MRQEELEGKERMLQMHVDKDNLDQARRHAVIQYVECRQKMLQSLSIQLDGEVSNDDSAPEDNEDEFVTEDLYDVIHDMDNFTFNVGVMNISGHQEISSAERLRSYDLDLGTKIEGRFGNSSLALVQYLVRPGAKNVSLDGSDGGVVEIDVVLSAQPEVPLQQGFLRFQFAGPESSNLSSVHWRVTQESLATQKTVQSLHKTVFRRRNLQASPHQWGPRRHLTLLSERETTGFAELYCYPPSPTLPHHHGHHHQHGHHHHHEHHTHLQT